MGLMLTQQNHEPNTSPGNYLEIEMTVAVRGGGMGEVMAGHGRVMAEFMAEFMTEFMTDFMSGGTAQPN